MRKNFYIYRYLSRILLFCSIALFSYNSFSQVRGDFKSITSGNWNSSSTWQMFDGSIWKDTTTTPGTTNSVFIGNNHHVTLTQDESCHNLNLHTGPNQHRLTPGSYILTVNGKLRAYTGAAPGANTSATPITNYWINTSGGGKILIVGNSRYITNTGEWGGGTPGWRLEVALNTGETGIFNTSLKAANIILTSGTMVFTGDNSVYPDSGFYGTGTVTIQSGATMRLKAGSIQRSLVAGAISHFARLDLNGTLAFDSTVIGVIGSAVINLNGTVAYTADGAQTFVTRGANSGGAHPNTHTNLELNGYGIKTLGLNTTVNGRLKLAGTASLSLGSYTRTYGGSSTLEYAGSTGQTTTDAELPASGAAPNLVINNPNGVLLHDSRTVSGQLSLTYGVISTGYYTLSIGSSGSVVRTSGHVAGKLQKHVPTGSPVLSYEIGDAGNYTPVALSFYGVTTAGDVTAQAVTGDHPDLTSSMIDGGSSVNRYWTIGNSGVGFSTCDAVFNFVSSDVDGGATPANFIAGKYDAPNWTTVNVGTKTPTSTEVTGLTSFSDFAIGEIKSYTITATARSNGSITPSGAVSVQYGEDQQFIIAPDDGYHLSSILVDGAPVDSTTSYTFYDVTQDHSIDVSFSINTYSLTVNATNGTVTKDPDQESYNHGISVQLTPVPATGYHFVNWSGDASGSDNPLTVIMNGDKNITANFAINTYSLTVLAENGTVAKDPDQLTYNHGSPVQLTATADPGYNFVGWSGDASGGDNPLTVIMDGDKNITAHFSANPAFTLTVIASNGSVVKDPDLPTYDSTSSIQLTATPDPGYHFTGWSGDASGSDNPLTVIMNGDKNITANFAINTYSLTVLAENGTVAKDPDQLTYNHGSSVQLTAIPDFGYHFTGWSGDTSRTDNPVTIIMNGPKTITANFVLNIYNITATFGSNGSITPAGVILVSHGGSQSFTIAANEGYIIEDVLVDGDSVGNVSFYEFTNVTTDHTIYATFSSADILAEFNVMDGWNLISVPVKRDDYLKTTLFPTALSDAFAYIDMYEVRDTLANGGGYWLKFGGNEPLSIVGAPRDLDTIEVNAGWNIIGSLSSDIMTTSVIPIGTTLESYFFIYKSGYEVAETVKVGSGLWIKVSNPGELVMSAIGAENNILKSGSNRLGSTEVFNKIKVTDEVNNSRMLYFGRKPYQEFSSGLYELPPTPPAGSFDVRFTDNWYLATFEELQKNISVFPINIKTAHWPVTFSWEVEANNDFKYFLEYTSKGRLKKIDLAGNRDNITLSEAEGSSVKLKVISVTLPKDYTIEQNYPNPFNPSTKIQFGLPVPSVVSLKIFNILGQGVATLIDRQMMDAGYREVEFNGDNLSTGIYFMNFTADGVGQESNAGHFTSVKKMIYGR